MRAMKVRSDIILSCIHCGRDYYLYDAVSIARAQKRRTALCPHCNKRVAGC